ncbi:MAG: copper resistance protein CopB [Sphingopyxis macrogoltabida]|uniref:Copper resistance protein CopB n=1 Tax=Sphingopyxis macrogoltabida TaxID=33050 RepID=A0A2W5MTE0_SPHMC|nr:MAG: copper resistance protein CopB [Sphingopyxis macrogoltabida]
MTRPFLPFACLSAIALVAAGPAAAQSGHGGHHGGHSGHGGAEMAPPPEPSPPADHAGPDDHGGHGPADHAPAAADGACTPDHAAMGHCTPQAEPAALPPAPAGPACTPDHAAMGHCTIAAPPSAAGETTRAVGTDLPPGDAPAPPPPADWYADRLFPADEMAHSRHVMMQESGGLTTAFLSVGLAEYQARKGRDGYRWDAEGWVGGDIDRLTIKSEGEGAFGESIESLELQALYSRAVGPYFNLQAGVRQDFGHGPDRTYAAVGFEGLAPYWFEVEGALFLSNKGDLLARVEASYDQRITQKLVLQPAAEWNVAVQDVPESGIGSGLSDMELGLRLRYEIVKEFAPYIGVEWARKFGDTARSARAAGEDADSVSLVIGVKTWF